MWDWKFFLTISVAIAGVVMPLVWQSDFSSKSMELRLSSIASLEPASQIRNLQIFLDGEKLEAPYSSTLELVNTGSKTILSKDFDTSIEISLNDGARYASAEITSTNPPNLPIEITTADHVLQISKHLSNPGDSVTVSVVTSGESPQFGVKARIAGVKNITLVDQTMPKPKLDDYLRNAIYALTAIGLYAVTAFFSIVTFLRPAFGVPRGAFFLVCGSSYLGAVTAFSQLHLDLFTQWYVVIPGALASAILVWMINRPLINAWERNLMID